MGANHSDLREFKLMLIKRYDDLEFIDELVDEFKCVTCHDVAIFPFLTNCNHVLCNACGDKIRRRTSSKCPECKTLITKVNDKPKASEEKINQLKMKCIEHKAGCNYEARLYKIRDHLKSCEKFDKSEIQTKSNNAYDGDYNFNGQNMYENVRKLLPEKELEFVGDVISANSDSELQSDSENDNDQASNGNYSKRKKKEYNVLLLGQTGVGKSTFVNAFANYMRYTDFNTAVQSKLKVLIPCQFRVLDDEFVEHVVKFGTENDSNEAMQKSEQSCTQRCKKYEFNYNTTLIRIFDTPGIGDTRGMLIDQVNIEDILNVVSDYEYLHCICILLKPNEARLVVTFEYCIKQLLSQLPKSASNNIVFVFTNSRGTFYKPGDTAQPLKAVLEQVKNNPPHVTIPFNKNNVFCLDNEAFRFLLAMKMGIKFNDKQWQEFGESWVKSGKDCKRMINYIQDGVEKHGMTPHKVEDTLSIYKARRAISELAKPLSEVAANLYDNLKELSEHKEKVKQAKGNLEELENLMFIPSLKLRIIKLKQPCTVCSSEKCVERYKSGSAIKFHYPQICHSPCYLSEGPKEAVGVEKLRHCVAIKPGTEFCRECKCHYSFHLQVYYKTKVEKKIDNNIKTEIKTKKKDLEIQEKLVNYLKLKEEEYKIEELKLTKYTAKFAIFLKQNAIVPYNNAFEGYIQQMINNEKSHSDEKSGLAQMLDNYKREMETLENLLQQDQKSEITANEVMNLIVELKKIKLIDETLPLDQNVMESLPT